MGYVAAGPLIAAGLLLGSCAYDPPVAGDHTSETYRANLAQCRQSVGAKIDLLGRSTFPGFLISPFTGPPRKRAGIRDCMETKGYKLAEP